MLGAGAGQSALALAHHRLPHGASPPAGRIQGQRGHGVRRGHRQQTFHRPVPGAGRTRDATPGPGQKGSTAPGVTQKGQPGAGHG